ncbi:GxxExxY protein [bacterium]|nr:GxxExxY protein [bacterium]|tara:strand:- start:5362 stop:5775 length:414 start_codon:yes stop_codon:yes gene_type:complete
MERNDRKKFLHKQESYAVQGAAFEVYKEFRNRHKEKVYGRAMVACLKANKLQVEQEKRIPIYFREEKVGTYIPDIVVNDCIFIELKCKPQITRDDIKQFWYYLKGSKYKVGYLINFGASNGVQIERRVYDIARKKKQ